MTLLCAVALLMPSFDGRASAGGLMAPPEQPKQEAPTPRRWSPIGKPGLDGYVEAIVRMPNGDLLAGGSIRKADGERADYIARWNGTKWSALDGRLDNDVRSLAVLPNGDVVAGGDFLTAESNGIKTVVNHVARWDGTAWAPLGKGVNGKVYSVRCLANGDVIAGGWFTDASGVAANAIARWDGTAWSALGSGMLGERQAGVIAVAVLANGDLVAGGDFKTAGSIHTPAIARWDGTKWSAMNTDSQILIYSLMVLPSGDLVAGGDFRNIGGVDTKNIARWDGNKWSTFGTGLESVVGAMAVLSTGELVADGATQDVTAGKWHSLAIWNGKQWSRSGLVLEGGASALLALPNGDLIVGGAFRSVGGVRAENIARWSTAERTPKRLELPKPDLK